MDNELRFTLTDAGTAAATGNAIAAGMKTATSAVEAFALAVRKSSGVAGGGGLAAGATDDEKAIRKVTERLREAGATQEQIAATTNKMWGVQTQQIEKTGSALDGFNKKNADYQMANIRYIDSANTKNAQYWQAKSKFEQQSTQQSNQKNADYWMANSKFTEKANQENANYWQAKTKFEQQGIQQSNQQNTQYWMAKSKSEEQFNRQHSQALDQNARMEAKASESANRENAAYWLRKMKAEEQFNRVHSVALGENAKIDAALAAKTDALTTSFRGALNPTTELASRLETLKTAGFSTAQVAQVMSKEISGATATATKYGQAIPQIVQAHAAMIPKLNETGGILDTLGLRWSTIKNMMAGLVAYRVIWAGFAAITGAIKGTIDASIDFGLAMGRLKIASGVSSGGIQVLGGELRQLAKDIVIPVLELSKLATVIARGGIDPQSLTGFTSAIAKFAEIAEIPFKEAATDVMQFMRNMGEAPENINKVTSVIFELGRASVASEAGVMRMASRLSGVLGPLGAKTPEVAALAAALADLGIRAEMGASSMQSIVTKMAQAVNEGGVRLRAFSDIANMPMQKFASLMRTDVMAAVTAFLEGVSAMREDGISLIGTLTEVNIHEVRRLQTLLRLTGSMEKFHEFLKLGPAAYGAGTASASAYNELLETSAKKIDKMKIAWTDLAITLGGNVSPVLAGIATSINNLVNNEAELSITGLTYAVTGLGVALARTEIVAGITALTLALKGLGAVGIIAGITAALPAIVSVIAIIATTLALYNIGKKVEEWKKYNTAMAGVDDTTASLYASSMHLADILNQEYGVVIPRGTRSLGDWNLAMETAIRLKKDMLFVGPGQEAWHPPMVLPQGIAGAKTGPASNKFFYDALEKIEKSRKELGGMDAALNSLVDSGTPANELLDIFSDQTLKKLAHMGNTAALALLDLNKQFEKIQTGMTPLGMKTVETGELPELFHIPERVIYGTKMENILTDVQEFRGRISAIVGRDLWGERPIAHEDVKGIKDIQTYLIDRAAQGIIWGRTENEKGVLVQGDMNKELTTSVALRDEFNIAVYKSSQRLIDQFEEGRKSNAAHIKAAAYLLDQGKELNEVYSEYSSIIEKYPEAFAEAGRWSKAMMGRMQETIKGGWIDIGSTIEKSLGDAVANFSFNVKSIFQSIRDSFNKLISDMIASWIHSFLRPILSSLANNMGSLFARFGFGSAMGGGMGGGVATTGAGVAQMLGQAGISGGSVAPGVVGAGSGGRFAGFMSGIGGSAIGGAGLGAMLGQNMGPYGAIAGGVGGGLLAAGLSGGMAAGAYGGTFMGGAMGAMAAALPWTIGIAAAGIAATLIYKSLTRGGTPSGAKESGRDFGVSVTPQTIDQFIQSIGLSKSGYEGVRKDIASSPKFLTEVLFPAAKAGGTTEAFLKSLESVTTAWGTFNFRSAFETWMKTGDSTALNKAFIAAFSVSQRLQEVLPDWQQQLMAAGDKSKGANASRVGIHFNPTVTGPTYRPVTTPTQRDAPVTVNITVEGYYDSAGAKKLFENEIGPELVNQLSMNKPLVGRSVTLKAAMRGALA